MTEDYIHSTTFNESDIIKIIRALDINKVHGHDNISVRMIKFCANAFAHPLTLTSQKSQGAGIFTT